MSSTPPRSVLPPSARRRLSAPVLVATLLVGVSGTSYAVTSARQAEAPSHAATVAGVGGGGGAADTDVASLLRGSYRADFQRLSGTQKPDVESVQAPALPHRPRVGQTLAATPGTWRPSAVRVSYQWYVRGSAVAGATEATFRVKPGALGDRIGVAVTAKKRGYRTATAFSRPTGTVRVGRLVAKQAPRIAGQPRVGKRLMVTSGVIRPAGRLRYQWRVGAKAVAGATRAAYRPTRADRGKRVKVVVTATKNGYDPLRVVAVARGPVKR